jgi:hypothetical protein
VRGLVARLLPRLLPPQLRRLLQKTTKNRSQ